MKTNVLIIGNGGREHAFAWKLAQSPRLNKLFMAPGNGGTSQIAQNIAIDPTNIPMLVEFAQKENIDLTIVGSEKALAAGIVNAFKRSKLRVFGPTKQAAEIETSKAFSKRLMITSSIPTAIYDIVADYDEAVRIVKKHWFPLFIKADGLADGKAAYKCESLEQAESVLSDLMVEMKHGNAGNRVIIENFLTGPEISLHALTDGNSTVLFPPAQDHKAISEGNKGKNTGGMGTIVPVPWVDDRLFVQLNKRIVLRTLRQLTLRKRTFRGLLFPGIIMAPTGPSVLEFNARFGDPETQSYMRLMETDLLEVLNACVSGKLSQIEIKWQAGFAACIVLASEGYPDDSKIGRTITGIEEAEKLPDVVVFHAGTEFNGELKTAGGRVLGVTATGSTLQAALDRAYEAVQLIHFEGMQYRRDIGAGSL